MKSNGFAWEPVPLKRRALRGAQAAMEWCGLCGAFARARQPRVAAVLNYHSVPGPDDEQWIDPSNATPRALFEEQMAFLARRRRVVGMSELVAMLERGDAPPPGTVVLTFDDGYCDFLSITAPILQRYSLPAILYLPSGYVSGGRTQWIDRLFTAFVRRTKPLDVLNGCIGNETGSLRAAYHGLAGKLLVAAPAARESLLREVEERLAPSARPPRLTLTWGEIRSLRERFPAIEIGAHTVEHVDLSSCASEEAEFEIRQSAADIDRELGSRPEHFAFPYGRSTEVSRRLAREAGYRSAAADGTEPVIRVDSDRYFLTRINAPTSMTMLRFMTGGAYPDLSRLVFRGRA